MITITVTTDLRLPMGEELEKICRETEQEMGQVGLSSIDASFSSALADQDGDVTTYMKRNPKSVSVVARGENVGVLEFGAGATTSIDEFAEGLPFGVYPGSWSEINTQEFVKYGSWHHKGEKYYYLLPTHAFEKAADEMLEHGKKVFEQKITEALKK